MYITLHHENIKKHHLHHDAVMYINVHQLLSFDVQYCTLMYINVQYCTSPIMMYDDVHQMVHHDFFWGCLIVNHDVWCTSFLMHIISHHGQRWCIYLQFDVHHFWWTSSSHMMWNDVTIYFWHVYLRVLRQVMTCNNRHLGSSNDGHCSEDRSYINCCGWTLSIFSLNY